MHVITIMIENYTMGPIPLVYLYYMCNYHYDENYTMGPNSTSLFILTLKKVTNYLPHTGAQVMTKVMRNEVWQKNLRKAYGRYFYFYFFNLK